MPVVGGAVVSPVVTLRRLDVFLCFLALRCLKKDKACVGKSGSGLYTAKEVGHAEWQGEWTENTFFINVKR